MSSYSTLSLKTPPPHSDTQDFLLGDTFMRNVYTVFNFGEFVSGSDTPTLQFLSVRPSTCLCLVLWSYSIFLILFR